MRPLPVYLFLVNAASFLLMLADKYKARKKLWRIPEAVLLGTAVLGGSLGCLVGMHLAHHKTKHLKFSVGVPIILSAQVIALIALRF